jgi:hypothetical protein
LFFWAKGGDDNGRVSVRRHGQSRPELSLSERPDSPSRRPAAVADKRYIISKGAAFRLGCCVVNYTKRAHLPACVQLLFGQTPEAAAAKSWSRRPHQPEHSPLSCFFTPFHTRLRACRRPRSSSRERQRARALLFIRCPAPPAHQSRVSATARANRLRFTAIVRRRHARRRSSHHTHQVCPSCQHAPTRPNPDSSDIAPPPPHPFIETTSSTSPCFCKYYSLHRPLGPRSLSQHPISVIPTNTTYPARLPTFFFRFGIFPPANTLTSIFNSPIRFH